MIITPNIIKREFIGAHGLISTSTHAGYLGVSGLVVDETKNTFTIQQDGKNKSVIKDMSVFQFQFSNGARVEIDGSLLVGRPEDRLKKTVKRLW
ncbi:MAG: ribonuclease P protein component 1 [Crenarchaeota archaeon]|nr:ribonuclease P protein component 1 [Thermoproteota archaeon]